MSLDVPLFEHLKDRFETLSVNQRVLARHLLSNYQKVAFSNVKELSLAAGVSEATVVRFAKALGFSGYPTLRKEIMRLVRVDLKGTERFQLTHEVRSDDHGSVRKVIRKEMENISNFEEMHAAQSFSVVVEALGKASEVVVCGARSSASLAVHFSFGLNKMGIRAQALINLDADADERIARLAVSACVVFIGFPRYLNRLIELLQFTSEQGIATIAISDSPFSPLQGDLNLYAPAESASFVAFHSAPLILLNALLNDLSMHDEQKTLNALSRFETLADRQKIFFKEQQPRRQK